MSYVLRAIIAPEHVLSRPLAWLADSRVIALPQGMAMIPLSRALREQYGPSERPWLYEKHGETWLPQALVPVLEELSRHGTVAYVESEYHGGDGEQCSIVWRDGERIDAEHGSYAVNSALGRLGVEREEGRDLFDTLGLGRQRSVEDWLEPPAPPRPGPAAEPPPQPSPQLPPARPWWQFWR
ncbi:MAG TPA: hypothetical protein VFS20_17250 [Longimicrobium sp.]|nr:hypothetical protein [Longimicrobium sp.]